MVSIFSCRLLRAFVLLSHRSLSRGARRSFRVSVDYWLLIVGCLAAWLLGCLVFISLGVSLVSWFGNCSSWKIVGIFRHHQLRRWRFFGFCLKSVIPAHFLSRLDKGACVHPLAHSVSPHLALDIYIYIYLSIPISIYIHIICSCSASSTRSSLLLESWRIRRNIQGKR